MTPLLAIKMMHSSAEINLVLCSLVALVLVGFLIGRAIARSLRALCAGTLGFLCVAVFSGCTTAPVAVTDKQTVIANAVEDTISIGLVPVLTKNPSYLAAADGVAAALGTFSGDTITPADVDAFLAKTKLAPEDARAVAGIVNAAWATYAKRYAQQVNANVRPDVKLFLGAISNGIHSAVAAARSTQSAS